MTESTVRAERFEPQFSAAPSYTWAVPQKPVSVRIPFALIGRLDHEAVESFRSLHSRGSEIGGFLLGYVSPGDPAAVSIEDYELVECDYSRGPLYRPSDADMGRFERAIERRRAAGGLVVAGFFRSHTRKGLALDADDLALFKARFSEPHNVALLIRPFAAKSSTAGIFIWEDGAVRGEASYLEFPFRSSELTPSKPLEEASQPLPEAAQPAHAQIVPIASRREIAPLVPPPFVEVPAPEIAPGKNPEPAAAENEPAPVPPAVRRAVKMARMAALAAAQLVVIVLLFVYPGFLLHRGSRSGVSTQQDSSALALRVENSGGELMLTWNRGSTAIKNATRAVLSISDGAQHENVDMDLALLHSGSIEYSPSSSDVVFRMEVTGAGQTKTTSESVRVLRTRPSPMPEPGQPAQASKGAPAPGPAKPAVASSDAGAPDSAPGQVPAPQAGARPIATPAKPFDTDSLSQRLRPVRPADMPDAPEVGRGGEAVSAPVPVGMNSMPPPLLTSAPPAAATPQSAPAQAANTARTSANGGQVQQAQLISRKDPEYPPIARQSGAGGEVILTAMIGVDGKVKDVKVVQGHPLLRNAAVAAVKQWVYKPTLLNGVPVEAETRISLNFVARR
ncbi:MAG: TonB family protein [Bryobacteraceae bacterium]|jgi:protein TonB